MTKPSIASATQVTVVSYVDKAIGGEAEVYAGSSTTYPTEEYEGRYFVKTSVTRGIYQYSGRAWVKVTSPSSDMVTRAAYDIMVAINAGYGNLADYIGSGVNFQTALIQNLFAQYIKILTGGAIYGGDRYNQDGTDNVASAAGFWLGASGILKANKVELSGSITATSGTFTGAIVSSSATITGGEFTVGSNFHVSPTGVLSAAGAVISGAITATSGSFTGAVYASSGSFTGAIVSSSATITGGEFTVGSNFHVSPTGVLSAQGAIISGAITATSGTFTGAIVSSSATITGGEFTVGSNFHVSPTGEVNSKSGKFVSADIKDATITNATVTGKATLAEVIISGVTQGSNIIKSSDSQVTLGQNNSFIKVKEFQICASGTVAVYFELYNTNQYSYIVSGAIYKNGSAAKDIYGNWASVAIGARQLWTGSTIYISVSDGDIISLWGAHYAQQPQNYGYMRSVRIMCAENPGILKYIGEDTWSA